MSNFKEFEQRKQDHIQFALDHENQANERDIFASIALCHDALPDFNFDDINITSCCLGEKVTKPFMISSMTAGHEKSIAINRHLIAACQTMEWVMGVGSQRRELTDPYASNEWKQLRKEFPHVPLLSNLGIAQLIEAQLTDVQRLVDGLEARALIIHCNPLQECIQPEGTPHFKGAWQALESLVKALNIPVVVKETGCGFSSPTLSRLNDLGIAAVDVSGYGGTHWGRIEGMRAQADAIRSRAAETFRHWGQDTVKSVQNAMAIHPSYEIWGSGGVRTGLDAAKLFALGVTMVGFAKPMLVAALTSIEDVILTMQMLEYELKVALFCAGAQNLSVLKEKICL